MSNVTALTCTKALISVTVADGRTWSITRAEILAIYATKGGSAASRKAATITDVLALAQTTLGVDYFTAANCTLDFNATDAAAEMLLTVA